MDCSTPAQESSSVSSTPSLTLLKSASKISAVVSPNGDCVQVLADFEASVIPDSSEKSSINTTKRKIDEQPAFIEISRKKIKIEEPVALKSPKSSENTLRKVSLRNKLNKKTRAVELARKKIKCLRSKNFRLSKRCATLKEIIKKLEDELWITKEVGSILQACSSNSSSTFDKLFAKVSAQYLQYI